MEKCNFYNGIAIIQLNIGETVCIPEEVATEEENELIQAIKEEVENRETPEVKPSTNLPALEERIKALEEVLMGLI